MTRLNLPEAPVRLQGVQYGMITPECEAAYKEWISKMLDVYSPKSNLSEYAKMAFVNELYLELVMLGYEEGSESAKMENDW